MDLKREDLFQIWSVNDAYILQSECKISTKNRLLKSGIISEDLKLTDKGIKVLQIVRNKFNTLNYGVPIEDRPSFSPLAMQKLGNTWVATIVKRKIILLDPTLSMALMTKSQDVKQKRAGKIQKARIEAQLIELCDMERIPVVPYVFQRLDDWTDVIWLAGWGVGVPIQAKFFDLVKSLYSTAFFSSNSDCSVIYVEVKGKTGMNGVSGLIMPIDNIYCEFIENKGKTEDKTGETGGKIDKEEMPN